MSSLTVSLVSSDHTINMPAPQATTAAVYVQPETSQTRAITEVATQARAPLDVEDNYDSDDERSSYVVYPPEPYADGCSQSAKCACACVLGTVILLVGLAVAGVFS